MVELWSDGVNNRDLITKKQSENKWNYPAGMFVSQSLDATSLSSMTLPNRYIFMPFRPKFDFRSNQVSFNVVTASGASEVIIFLFNSDPLTGLPLGQIFNVTAFSLQNTGEYVYSDVEMKSVDGNFNTTPLSSFLFKANTPYWLGFYSSGGGVVRSINITSCFPLSHIISSNTVATCFTHTGAFNQFLDSNVGLPNFSLISSTIPSIRFRTIQV